MTDREERLLEIVLDVLKHGRSSHDQLTHGNWAHPGYGMGSKKPKTEKKPTRGGYGSVIGTRKPKPKVSASKKPKTTSEIRSKAHSEVAQAVALAKPLNRMQYHVSFKRKRSQGKDVYNTTMRATSVDEKRRMGNKLGGRIGLSQRKSQFDHVRKNISSAFSKEGISMTKVSSSKDTRSVVSALNHTQVYKLRSTYGGGLLGELIINAHTRGVDIDFTVLDLQ